MSDTTWGDFQSVIQLSVGLNAAYAALFSFVEDVLTEEAEKALATLRRLQGPDDPDPAVLKRKILVRSSLSQIMTVKREATQFNKIWLKPICALFTLLGMLELVGASYYAHEPISTGWTIVTWLLLAPVFFAIILYSYHYITIFVTTKITQESLRNTEAVSK